VKRRDFITLLGGATAWPLGARAQQPDRVRRVGSLTSLAESDADAQAWDAAFRKRLEELGWTLGRNMEIDFRYAAGDVGRIRAYAAELVGLKPDAILAFATPTVAALQLESRTIPIVFSGVSDPIGSGFVENLPTK
jgi:putative ABC transport system substrate-binding protein